LIVKGDNCPLCGGKEFTTSWAGLVEIIDIESDIAKAMEIEVPGKYALRVR
jgi:RNA polymerase subunit RPABC4/transcription elongation factor Spt4